MKSARPDPLAHHLLSMAYNNAWANDRLLRACAQLSQAEFEAQRCSFFPSIKATLNHNLCVDWFYVDALEREQQGLPPHADCYSFFAVDEPFERCAELQQAQSKVDLRLIALCGAQHDDQLERIVTIARPGRPQLESRTRLLAHLFQHQIHHRGQVHAMLAGSSVAPPQLDEFFCAGEADERAAEFAALGWTETLIWGQP
ncbi:DinB family protein [Paucibacter sp. TC2R-5]|uniref:DinB family protein n=1 Tax=Paucibacter sp. TC2R-5 TaxID=2893555 RepID=UPI0021E4C0B1|nr:DinB family protein [Paucibacter sp. TC2R-5]MCV2359996.1 DinB family protein [Paucibacter sp. TC2R-5]